MAKSSPSLTVRKPTDGECALTLRKMGLSRRFPSRNTFGIARTAFARKSSAARICSIRATAVLGSGETRLGFCTQRRWLTTTDCVVSWIWFGGGIDGTARQSCTHAEDDGAPATFIRIVPSMMAPAAAMVRTAAVPTTTAVHAIAPVRRIAIGESIAPDTQGQNQSGRNRNGGNAVHKLSFWEGDLHVLFSHSQLHNGGTNGERRRRHAVESQARKRCRSLPCLYFSRHSRLRKEVYGQLQPYKDVGAHPILTFLFALVWRSSVLSCRRRVRP